MPRYVPITVRILEHIGPSDSNGCWNWTGSTCKGYAQTKLSLSRRTARVARLILEGVIGELPTGMMACHTCDNPACVNPEHLFAGTATDNMRDCAAKHRNYIAPLNSKDHKTTVSQRRQIQQLYAMGVCQQDLATQFGVGQTRISQIVNGGKDRRRYRKEYPADLQAAIVEAYRLGMTQPEIAKRYTVWQSTVSRIVRRHGLGRRQGVSC